MRLSVDALGQHSTSSSIDSAFLTLILQRTAPTGAQVQGAVPAGGEKRPAGSWSSGKKENEMEEE
jgi:hypothetical protein